MSLVELLQGSEPFALQRPLRPGADLTSLKETHVAFSGSPMKHPEEDDKVLLVADPFSSNPFCYLFSHDDIGYIEKLSSLGVPGGQTIPMARVWVKKGAVGMQQFPFVVGAPRQASRTR